MLRRELEVIGDLIDLTALYFFIQLTLVCANLHFVGLLQIHPIIGSG